MSSVKRKLKYLSLKEKVQIISYVEEHPGVRQKDIICHFEELDLAQSTLSRLLVNKDKLKKWFESGKFSAAKKRMRKSKFEEVDEALLTWFTQARASNMIIYGGILQTKATGFAEQFGYATEISMGWISRWKTKHGIGLGVLSGESASVSVETVDSWKSNQLKSLLEKFAPQDIFNADETGLFWKLMPEKLLVYEKEKAHRG